MSGGGDPSRWCQRWARRRPTWAYADASDRFDRRGYEVLPVSGATAEAFCAEHHYLGSYPASSRHRFGLFHCGQLVGVAVYGIPPSVKVLTNPLPDLVPYEQSTVLSRLVLAPTPGNAETFMLGECRAFLLDAGVRAVITFADPSFGHFGIVYQAFNCVYLGTTKKRTTLWLPDQSCLDERTVQKIRGQESGHEAAERRLIAAGARAPRAGEKPHAWLRQALVDAGVERRMGLGKHRYGMPLRKDVRIYRYDRSGRRVRAHRDPSRYPKPPADLFTAMGVQL